MGKFRSEKKRGKRGGPKTFFHPAQNLTKRNLGGCMAGNAVFFCDLRVKRAPGRGFNPQVEWWDKLGGFLLDLKPQWKIL